MTTAEDVLLTVSAALADCFGEEWRNNTEAVALHAECTKGLKNRTPRFVQEEILSCINAKKRARNGDGW